MKFKQPLSVFFVYHPKDLIKIKESLEFCCKILQRDCNRPFSRYINIPVFYNTSLDENVPKKLKSKSNKTIVFLLISKYILANENWYNYYNDFCENKNIITIPVALDDTAINFEPCESRNFIRTDLFDKEFYKEIFLMNILHEIYRWVLNHKKRKLGKDKALKIFLSHTKADDVGCNIAKQIKHFIDNTNLRRFFDTNEIAPNYNFDEEIKNNLNDSTVLTINSDHYSSRYWCQKEIIYAKEKDRPIIELNCLNKCEDRKFPQASNIAVVHYDMTNECCLSEIQLYEIILSVIIETIRYNYAKILLNSYKNAEYIPKDAVILAKPPEFLDIIKFIGEKDLKIDKKTIIYPEPRLYDFELDYFKNIGFDVYTPVNYKLTPETFSNLNIGLSISEPNKGELLQYGIRKEHLNCLSQDLAKFLLSMNSSLIYGGDLREGGFTKFLFDEALILQNRLHQNVQHITNYIAYPIYLKDDEEITNWKAKYKKIADMISVKPPEDINPTECFGTFIIPNSIENKYIWCRGLTQMRNEMIDNCDVRICAGGRHTDYKGIIPGVLEEIIIAVSKKKPVFLLGGFGGIVSDVCELIKTEELPQKLTMDWQIKNNGGYEDLINYYNQQKAGDGITNYSNLPNLLNFKNLNNGLTKKENLKLFETPFIEEAIILITQGLSKIQK